MDNLDKNLSKAIVVVMIIVSIIYILIFLTPRNIVAMADDKLLPSILSKYNKKGTSYAAIIFSDVLAILIAVSGTFTQLAAISVVSRFIQYVPACLAVIVLRKKNPEKQSSLRIPFGPVIPIISVVVSI